MIKKITLSLSRYIIALLFIFSGFVKSVDPMGGAIKFEEYLAAFGFTSLIGCGQFLAIALAVTEMIIGFMVLLGWYKRIFAWLSMAFMVGFTILTIIIYRSNPVEDCGCFGEFIKLSNGETLLKNIILSTILLPYFLENRSAKSEKNRIFGVVIIAILSLFAPIYGLVRLPLLDFLPYKEGVNILESMEVPEGKERDEYETFLKYRDKKSGKIETFTLQDTTWYDSNRWEYISTESKMVKKGYTPPISSFSILDENGQEQTKNLLKNRSKIVFFVIASSHISDNFVNKLEKKLKFFKKNDFYIAFLTSQEIKPLKGALKRAIPEVSNNFYNIDQTTIKSFLRAKYGYVTIEDGVIKEKQNLLF